MEQSATSGRGGGKRSGEGMEVGSDNEDGAGRKKLRLNKEQAAVLEQSFKDHPTLNPVCIYYLYTTNTDLNFFFFFFILIFDSFDFVVGHFQMRLLDD